MEKSRHAYQQAFDLATKNMPPTDPILLGLVLNFSVFYYEIANAAPEAAQLAKKVRFRGFALCCGGPRGISQLPPHSPF